MGRHEELAEARAEARAEAHYARQRRTIIAIRRYERAVARDLEGLHKALVKRSGDTEAAFAQVARDWDRLVRAIKGLEGSQS